MFLFKYLWKNSPKTTKEKEKKKDNSMKRTKGEKEEKKLCPSSTTDCLGLTSSTSYNHQVGNYCKSRETSTRASRSNFAQTTTSSLFQNAQFTSHMSLPCLSEAFSSFIQTFPKFIETQKADLIRHQNYPHLSNHVSFDYTGFSLFDHGTHHHHRIQASSSNLMNRIMSFVNISEEQYTMVCTANKASSFKLLAETYPFKKDSNLLTVYDHDCEAVIAMQETAYKRGAKVMTASFSWPNLRINSTKLKKALMGGSKKKGLFVFPLQSRMSGARYAYFWMRMAQENGWDVVLDASALGQKDMDSLGLSFIQPDFIVCSFHQVLGLNPSGFSTLLVRNNSSCFSLAIDHKYILHDDDDDDDDDDEDENIDNECKALDHADSLGLLLIGSRMRYITNWLVLSLTKLHHPYNNGCSLVRIYGPKVRFERGNAIAFNVYDWKGERIEPQLVQKLADRSNIALTCGFLRGMWFSEKYEEEKKLVLEKRKHAADNGKKDEEGDFGIEVVNATIGFMANFEDVYKLWCFVAKFLDADFVEKERWRYMALNQKMIEV